MLKRNFTPKVINHNRFKFKFYNNHSFLYKTYEYFCYQKSSTFLKHKNKLNIKGFTILEILVTIIVIKIFLLLSLQATVLATLLRIENQNRQNASNWVQDDLELIKYHAFSLPFSFSHCGNYGEILKNNLDGTIAGIFLAQEIISIPDDNPQPYDIIRKYNVSENILQITYTLNYNSDHPRYSNFAENNEITTLSTEIIPNAAFNCTF